MEGDAGMAANRVEAAARMKPIPDGAVDRHAAGLHEQVVRVVACIRQKQATGRYGASEILTGALADLDRMLQSTGSG